MFGGHNSRTFFVSVDRNIFVEMKKKVITYAFAKKFVGSTSASCNLSSIYFKINVHVFVGHISILLSILVPYFNEVPLSLFAFAWLIDYVVVTK